eukprot:Hpha_TRINITY_DN16371_c6_g5::TRINITY_DN16371_c6_g5_i1::g.58557::m.58557
MMSKKRCKWFVRAGDTRDDVRIKTMLFPFSILSVLFCIPYIFDAVQRTRQWIDVIGISIGTAGCCVLIAGVMTNAVKLIYVVDTFLVACTVGILLHDLGEVTRSFPFRAWTILIVMLDVACVFKRDSVTRFAVPVILVYNAAVSVESFERFGLFEVGYWGTVREEVSQCSCASPPCSLSLISTFLQFGGISFVILADTYFTRGFASALQLQLRRMEASVDVVANVAAALVRYDVDEAAKAIDSGKDLPEELVVSFRRLLSNLD